MNCVCGHSAGHHDDEPNGCWDCACAAWSQNDGEPTRGAQSRTSPDGSVTVMVPCDETSGELP